jgi:hypothetical protein
MSHLSRSAVVLLCVLGLLGACSAPADADADAGVDAGLSGSGGGLGIDSGSGGGGGGAADAGPARTCLPCRGDADCGADVCLLTGVLSYPTCHHRCSGFGADPACPGSACHSISATLWVCAGEECSTSQRPDAGALQCEACAQTQDCYAGYACKGAAEDAGLRCVLACLGTPTGAGGGGGSTSPSNCPENFACTQLDGTVAPVGQTGICGGTCF